MPFFSVLLPTKNKRNYIGHAIKSALNQTFPDFELVISDNVSSDGTPEIIKSFTDKRIKYFRTEKSVGINQNWNNAYKHSSGNYLILMGDDDFLMPDYLLEVKKLIDQGINPDIVLVGGADYNELLNRIRFKKDLSQDLEEFSLQDYLKRIFNFDIPASNGVFYCYSRQIAEKVGNEKGPYASLCPDYYLQSMIFVKAKRVIKINRILAIAGVTKKSTSNLQRTYDNRKKIFSVEPDLDVLTPLKGNYLINSWYRGLVSLKQKFPAELKEYEINKNTYYYLMGNMIIEFLIKSLGKKEFKIVFREFKDLLTKTPFKMLMRCLFFYMPQKAIFVLGPQSVKDYFMNLFNRFEGNTRGIQENIYLDTRYSTISDCAKFLIKKGHY